MLKTTQGSLKVLAEHPALDLLNSIDADRGRCIDFLQNPSAIAPWSVAAGLLAPQAGEELQRRFDHDAALAEAVRSDVIALRAHLGQLMNGRADEGLPPLIDRLLPRPLLRPDLRLNVPEQAPEQLLLAQLALAATDLTLGSKREQVRQCEAPHCDWYFLDHSGRRRWCIMQGCGNAAKARRHRARVKEAL